MQVAITHIATYHRILVAIVYKDVAISYAKHFWNLYASLLCFLSSHQLLMGMMALQAKLKSLQNSRKASGNQLLLIFVFRLVATCGFSYQYAEKYYLVFWKEGTVSIHKDGELREPPMDDQVTVKFGRKWHTGRIICYGKLRKSYSYNYSWLIYLAIRL